MFSDCPINAQTIKSELQEHLILLYLIVLCSPCGVFFFFLQIESKDFHQQKGFNLLKAQMMVIIFSNEVFFNLSLYIVFLNIMPLHNS